MTACYRAFIIETMELKIKYRDEDDRERETTLKDIISEIGFEYSIPDDVSKLTSLKEIIEVSIDNVVVWRIS